jgi:hypothetical protein
MAPDEVRRVYRLPVVSKGSPMRPFRPLTVALVLIVAFLAAAPVVSASSRQTKMSTTGYDISWPQCGGSYPSRPAFGIVGVNAGIVFSANACLSSELAWAGGASGQLYANTGNPGPALSTHWPDGQASPESCNPTKSTSLSDRDTAACAYDYGYNAAADSYTDAVLAFGKLGLGAATPAGGTWWFDVETSNSWRTGVALNVADLQGAVFYLSSVGVTTGRIGFYSTQYQWNQITGGTTGLAGSPSWVAGARTARQAASDCSGPGFTGGGVALAQYPSGGFDADVRCP